MLTMFICVLNLWIFNRTFSQTISSFQFLSNKKQRNFYYTKTFSPRATNVHKIHMKFWRRKFQSRKQQKWPSMIFTPFYIPMIYVSCVAFRLHPHTPPPDDERVKKDARTTRTNTSIHVIRCWFWCEFVYFFYMLFWG